MLGARQGRGRPRQVRPSIVEMVSKTCACESAGGMYTLNLEEKVVGGRIKAQTDVVVGRNGRHLSGDVIYGLIDRRGLCSRMEVVK